MIGAAATPRRAGRRTINMAIRAALESGSHQLRIDADGGVTILPIHVPVAQGDAAAQDAEIQRLLNDGDG